MRRTQQDVRREIRTIPCQSGRGSVVRKGQVLGQVCKGEGQGGGLDSMTLWGLHKETQTWSNLAPGRECAAWYHPLSWAFVPLGLWFRGLSEAGVEVGRSSKKDASRSLFSSRSQSHMTSDSETGGSLG